MQLLPKTAIKIEVKDSTVDFYKYMEDGVTNIFFDSSTCTPPGPMVNAMAGLKILDKNSKLIMINHLSPEGLFPKIDQNYNYKITQLDDGRVKVEFTCKENTQQVTDFTDNQCGGGC